MIPASHCSFFCLASSLHQKKLTVEAEAFSSAARTAASDLSRQAGSVNEQFSSALREEQHSMKRYELRLLWLSLLPTALTLVSLLAWALWLR